MFNCISGYACIIVFMELKEAEVEAMEFVSDTKN